MKTIPVCLFVTGMFLPAICLAQAVGGPPDEPRREGPDNRGPRQMMEFWKTVDQNQDGSLSKEEFNRMPRIMNLPEEKRLSLFERLDKDSDGRLGREELVRLGGPTPDKDEPPMRRLWELDVDKSGGINLDEFRAGSFFKKLPQDRQVALFERLDTDGDGIITPRDRPEPPFKRGAGEFKGKRPERPDQPDSGRSGGERPDPRQMFRQLDKDSDGFLNFEEFRAGPIVASLSEDEQEDRFEALDKDGDLKLGPSDFSPPPPHDGGRRGQETRPGGE